MIKIQPSHSRIVRTEGPDRLQLTCPARGLGSFGGFLLLIALVWIAGMVWVMLQIEQKVVRIGAGFLMIPPVMIGLAGAAMCAYRWSLERSAEEVIFRRGGLWGSTVKKWPAQDVSSFWVSALDEAARCTLILGFRNGRSEELVLAKRDMEEDLQWVAAIMKDPKGARRTLPGTTRAAAEPVSRRSEPSVDPPAVAVRKFEGGVELRFLPLLDFRGRWGNLLGTAFLGVAGILIASAILIRFCGPAYPMWITRVAVGVWLLGIVGRFAILRQSTTIRVVDGQVTVLQNQHRGDHKFPVSDVEFVQTFRASGDTELQFLLKGKPKVRLLHDRPGDELEWAARFLRVAIKGRAPEEAAAMKIETAEGQCQVCGEKMESRVVFCAKCRTPHHEECWSYVGTCSTFGCREIRFTRA